MIHQPSTQVTGVRSAAGHLNHPDAMFCRVTGMRLGAHLTLRADTGRRPPVGVVVTPDGREVVVDADVVVGRSVGDHPDVASGHATGAVLDADDRTVSRHHLRLRAAGWTVEVIDLHSTNGVRIGRAGVWTRVTPGGPTGLVDGDQLAVGSAVLCFRSLVLTG